MNKIIQKYLDKYPNVASMTLAKKIYNENKLHFKDVDSIRSNIRNYRGSMGKKRLKELSNTQYLPENKMIEKYNLPISIEQDYKPFYLIAKKLLIFSDFHIPFQDNKSITAMFDFCIDKGIDSIVIDGDLMDCFAISRFDKEPNKIRFVDEIKLTKQFLDALQKTFIDAKIYYKFGNHENFFEKYLMTKAPDIFDNPEFHLNVLLDLYNKDIQYIEEDRYIVVNGELKILHGHEYKNGISSPANPARTAFLRSKSNCIVGHHHQTSQHVEQRIDGELISCWSLGCLSTLHPKYQSLNKYNHGFAIYTQEDEDFWHVKNYMIIKGRVV
jgi:predicted phosphodiesterase